MLAGVSCERRVPSRFSCPRGPPDEVRAPCWRRRGDVGAPCWRRQSCPYGPMHRRCFLPRSRSATEKSRVREVTTNSPFARFFSISRSTHGGETQTETRGPHEWARRPDQTAPPVPPHVIESRDASVGDLASGQCPRSNERPGRSPVRSSSVSGGRPGASSAKAARNTGTASPRITDGARKLVTAYTKAVAQIACGPSSWFTHPRPYPDIAPLRVSPDQGSSIPAPASRRIRRAALASSIRSWAKPRTSTTPRRHPIDNEVSRLTHPLVPLDPAAPQPQRVHLQAVHPRHIPGAGQGRGGAHPAKTASISR